ncbi:hypothetical protein BOTBODRAFT_57715 [Botryobasidium botryosum FD-172 SS1]|uniref:INO80 complex subunit B-like conserved region domain-containing protein n=1 Tax=Botryobasidium botryosum (strain FD-172 SS1) TaxID=930990 RepID=A0A067MGG0_BOTB1|nr:hypothetical protein BOTBODRAFT_57715 [Botryobasidium botryosum FD-172 SS1]
MAISPSKKGKAVEVVEDIDIESEDDDVPPEEEDDEEAEGEEDELAASSDAEPDATSSQADMDLDEPEPSRTPLKPSLPIKFKLKLGGLGLSARSIGTLTPTPSEGGPSNSKRDEDFESEEEDELGDEDAQADADEDEIDPDDMDENASVISTSRMTARQAALSASGFEVQHVELTQAPSRKKKFLNEAELALRRSETARKRKHQTEKKLEDDKTETINRLLKKQSARTRSKKEQHPVDPDTGAASAGPSGPLRPAVYTPPSYRWISTSRDPTGAADGQPNMTMSFSIPPELLPSTLPLTTAPPVSPAAVPKCAAPGCGNLRKYKLVGDMERGACGLECFKILKGH